MLEAIDIGRISKILTQGADERLFTDSDGRLKYGISLTDWNIINRGSCTCNPIDRDDLHMIHELLAENKSDEDWIALRDQLESSLKKSLSDQKDEFEVLFAPSGTDLVYYPMLLGRILHGAKPILNVITCLEELGSGTKLAAQGRYHSSYSQFGETLPSGKNIFPEGTIKTFYYNARSKAGEILRHDKEITNLINDHSGHTVVVNLVFGSKSGIEDSLDLIDELQGRNIIWCVDMCQFRHSRKVINLLLGKNALVMLTGSKFYQAPPFCAAILIPQKMYAQIRTSPGWNEVEQFKSIFSKCDFPLELRDKLILTEQINVAEILRWACAMREIVTYKRIPEQIRLDLINRWNAFVIHQIKNRDYFELMPDQEYTNKSIISFRLKIDQYYLTHDELKQLHRELANPAGQNGTSELPIFIGQPVAYGNRSFLRIAIGAKNIRQFKDMGENMFDDDLRILDAISLRLKTNYANK